METTELINLEVEEMKEQGIDRLPRDFGQLVQASKCYMDHYKTMIRRDGGQPRGYIHPNWPQSWSRESWQPENDPQRNLIKAMALMVLECERLLEVEYAPHPYRRPLNAASHT